ncbi:MAG: 3'-5' exonuclease [Anaerolineae bacterium]|nr:3'-5' exonuclease [Anaerolineae bacterium]
MTSDLLSGLNEQQYAAVTAGGGPVLVLAGPGSGKTGVLTRRVAFLIQEMTVKPWHIMAVTFTNKAATEMRYRIGNYLDERVPGLQVGTFHATCAKILRIEHEATSYNRDYTIYDTDDQVSAIRQVMNDLNIDTKRFSPRRVLNAISHAKNEVILPHNYVGQDYFTEIVSRVYPRYQSFLVSNNAMDFDDLLVQMVLLLRNNDIVRQRYQDHYPFVLVDEFQDTNTVQYQLVELISKPQSNVFVVGDEDQSIYAFRGADFRNVMRFRQDYPQAKVVVLEQNYRSTQIVLDVARAVIEKNMNRTRKALFTDRKGGELVTVHEAYNDEYEADYVMERIHDLQKRDGYNLSDFAIMYRTNAQSRALEAACRNHNLPYRLVGGVSFYQRREIKDLIAYMRVVNNPDDKISFARIVNVPKRGIGKKSLQDFHRWCADAELGYGEALEKLRHGEATPLSNRVSSLFTKFAQQAHKWQEHIAENNLIALFDDIVADTAYTFYLQEISDDDKQREERTQNVRELRGFLATYEEDEHSLSEFLQEQQLMTDEDRSAENLQNADGATDKITLLTLHAAKGLEYPVVFITGLEDGLLPHSRSFEDPDGLEEERRLFYVGITRAKDLLFLTYTFKRSLYGGYSTDVQAKSAFLYDIPEDLLNSDAANLGYSSDEYRYQRTTKWDNPNNGLNRLQRDLREASKPTGHVSDENLRSKIIPFPGSDASQPLRFKGGQKVHHSSFGRGIVIESKRIDGAEIVSVIFDNTKFGIKSLDAEFANLTLL